jgi:NADPH:quinone reductase-like Zn-dependent oxidoreductase
MKKANEYVIGASEIINYVENPNWEGKVLELTNGKGGESINRSIAALKPQGFIYIIGFLKGMMSEVNLFSLLSK